MGDTDDEGTSKDIEQEARIIIHVALQNTLKRLGVVHTESGDIIEERDLIGCCTVGEYEKPNVESKIFMIINNFMLYRLILGCRTICLSFCLSADWLLKMSVDM